MAVAFNSVSCLDINMYYGEPINYVPRKAPHCCKRYGLEFCLCLWLLIVTGCLLFITYLFYKHTILAPNICVRKQCIKSSNDILSSIDLSADPCKNFEQFSCGTFKKLTLERNISSSITSERDRVRNQLTALITAPQSLDDSEIIVMQKIFYKSCLDLDKTVSDNHETFLNLVKSIGGWPILEGDLWCESNFEWLDAMVSAKKIGLPFDWFLTIEPDGKYLKFSYPKLCNLARSDFPREYLKFMLDVIVNMTALGAAAIPEINDIFNFEQELDQICGKSYIEDMSIGSNVTIRTIKDLQQFSKIDWITFLEKFKQQHNWTEESLISYNSNHYLFRLENLLFWTSKRIQANYIVWKLIENFAPFLSKPVRELYENYIFKRYNYKFDRFSFCLNETRSKFRRASDVEYIRKHTKPPIKREVTEIVELIKQELINYTRRAVNIDNNTKHHYTERIKKINLEIGGSRELFSGDFVSKYLHMHVFNYSSDNVVGMIAELSQSFYESRLNSRTERKVEDFSIEKNLGLTIWFYYEQNILMVPVTILQEFFYELDRPQYLNFAGLGTLLVSEMLHIINDSRVKDNVVSLNGLLAPEIAYKAYEKWVENYGPGEMLPGLYFETNQLFWIKFGILGCSQRTPSTHYELDINLSNIQVNKCLHFRKDFACPVY